VTDIVAEGGYPTMKITEIARRAAVSLTTFYEHFDGKEDAFVAAIARWRDSTLEAVLPAYQAAETWPHAVASALHALFGFFTLNQSIGRLGGVVAYEGGEQALAVRDDSIAAFHVFLEEGYRLHPSTPAIYAEAIGSSIYALFTRQLRYRGADRLYQVAPTAAFMALAPFVGSDQAAVAANTRPALPKPREAP
jgi:AcrR family transcriptional regulator